MGLYSVQQQLARQQMLMEREADSHASLQQLRLAKEATLAQVREMYRSMLEQLRSEQQQSESQTATTYMCTCTVDTCIYAVRLSMHYM